MSSTSTASAGAGESDDQLPVVSVSTVAWKRRSGFGKLSGSVGIGSSWERRKIVLIGEKLAYYTLTDDDEGSSKEKQYPRGTLDIISERLTVSPAIHSPDMPTPYGLYLRVKAQHHSMGGEDVTKWKLCFDTRKQQAAFLLALSDVVVSRAVADFNKAVLATESDKWVAQGGFHKLYEEGEQGTFRLVRGVLLQEDKVEKASTDSSDNQKTGAGDIQIPASRTKGKGKTTERADNDKPVSDEQKGQKKGHEQGGAPGLETAVGSFTYSDTSKDHLGNDTVAAEVLHDEVNLPPMNVYAIFGLVNIIILYTFWVARSSSSPVLSLWQVLVVVNLGLWLLLNKPLPTSPSLRQRSISGSQRHAEMVETNKVKQHKKDEAKRMGKSETTASKELLLSSDRPQEVGPTVSAVGAELLRARDVPVSEVLQGKSAGEKGDNEVEKEASTENLELHPEQKSLTMEEMDFHTHERWAISDSNVDLTGSWVLIADEPFKAEYDIYLKNLGFNRITRGVAVSLISRTTEVTRQSDRGRSLYLCGKNPKGAWERTIMASGYPDFETQSERSAGKDYSHRSHSIQTAEAEEVEAEAWWEDRGTKHISWLRGGTKYGGGDFESRRYLENSEDSNSDILVCDSVFHPKKKGKETARVTWR
eukprot:CAMPEP_0113557938 /NCGR_PEP_ID=MMETSP0015_2-20120614/18069_1 /TAXON_ID=2838 /ORGANISM="Odontella" /LENGTH=645 /DNA_ID=CAMNT_0000459419 /DNA_START=50 /DNA_END=1984 /DNA_ORIENTATION=+ /assembly_acc=CAM_ASM_000160